MSKSGWSRKFDEPIPLPKGRQLVTLRDEAPRGRAHRAGMAGRNGGLDFGRDIGRPNDVRADRRYAGAKSER